MSIDTDFVNEVEKLNAMNSVVRMSAHLDQHSTENTSHKR